MIKITNLLSLQTETIIDINLFKKDDKMHSIFSRYFFIAG